MSANRTPIARHRPGRIHTAKAQNQLIERVNDLLPVVKLPQGTLAGTSQRENPEQTNARPDDIADETLQQTDPAIEQAGGTLVYSEVSRSTSTVRVENPDDEEQYVDVERLDSVTFVGPDGNLTLIFNN